MDNKTSALDPQLLGLAVALLSCAIFRNRFKWEGPLFILILSCVLGGLLWLFLKLKNLTKNNAQEKMILGPTKDAVYCGKTREGRSVYIKTQQRIMHTQIIGTTNAGKTESVILPWAIQDIEQGRGLLLLDGKADRGLLDKLWAYTNRAGRKKDFRLFSLSSIDHSDTFNPLCGGTADEIAERIFSAFTFENPFYKSLQYEVLSQVLRLFESVGEIPTFSKIYRCIGCSSALQKLSEKCTVPELVSWATLFQSLPPLDREQRSTGLLTQLSPFAFGQASKLFDTTTPSITIENSLRNNQIVYFQLPVLLSPFLGSATGKLVLQSLQAAIANRHRNEGGKSRFFSVFLDDFSEYLYPGFVSVLNKSRSANIGVVFAHQALGDIEVLGASIANSILTNSNLKIFMRGNDPNSAEHFSKIIGTTSTIRMTERKKLGFFRTTSTGDVSAREVEEFIVHPNCFKSALGVGQAVMVVPHNGGSKTLSIQFDKYPDLPEIDLEPKFSPKKQIEEKECSPNSPLSEVVLEV